MPRRRNDSALYVVFPAFVAYRCGFLALNDSEAFTSDGGSWRQGKREESAFRLTFDPVNRSPPSLIKKRARPDENTQQRPAPPKIKRVLLHLPDEVNSS